MWWIIAGVAFAGIVIWFVWGNVALKIKKITVVSEEIPSPFSGYKVAHVSDVHNSVNRRRLKKLVERMKGEDLDAIFITGDLIDSRRTRVSLGVEFVKEIGGIAPCYMVSGNHESRLKGYGAEIVPRLQSVGAKIIDNDSVVLERDGAKITLIGVSDPAFHARYVSKRERKVLSEKVERAVKDECGYKILLCHRPEGIDEYANCGVDMVFSGHAHGGQIQLPIIGGVYAPGQGLFPRYDKGVFQKGKTKMVLSGGMGNGIIPTRVFNRPELLIVTIKKEN